MFTKFLRDVEPLVPPLMRALTRRYWNARAKNESGQFRRLQTAPKFIGLGYYKLYIKLIFAIRMSTYTNAENMGTIGPVLAEIFVRM